MSELPEGWTTVAIGDLGEWRGGGTPSKAKPEYWTGGTVPWVSAKDMKRDYIAEVEDYITEEAIAGSATQLIDKNSVLVVTRSGILRHSLPVGVNTVPVTINQDLKALTPHAGIETDFIMRQFQADAQIILADCMKTGTTVESVNFERFKARDFRVAPLPEQRRIVAKVDGLTARTARAGKDLNRIPTLIARYKQRLLAQAFTGELIGKRPASGEAFDSGCWDIPTSWQWTRFVDVAEIASNLVKPETIPDLPHIAPDNIEAGTARLLPYRTIAEDKLISAKNRFYPGQVLYSKIRPYLKKAVLIDFEGACSADMYPISARPGLHSKYLLYWLISDSFAQFSARHEGRTVLPKINQKALNATPFPLPPKEDQIEIVRRIESAFGWLDRMAADHAAAARLLPKLDAAILAKAFRGELVPQDPNDEPASALLARIKAEREAVPKEKSGRGRRPKSPPITATASGEVLITGSATATVGPRKTGKVAMTKSRQDDDVKHKPYLAGLLKSGRFSDAQSLFRAANLSVADFYKQLAWEIDAGHIVDSADELKAA